MKMMDTGRKAVWMLWQNKSWWFFGLFVAGGGGAAANSGGAPAGANGEADALVAGLLPALLALATLLGALMLVMHVLSEAALIAAVRDERDGLQQSVRTGLRRAWQHFWTVLGIKGVALGGLLLLSAMIALPIAAGAVGWLPALLSALLAVPLVAIGVPAMLTVYFLYMWALRIAVLEDRTALDALASARRFLPGRLLASLKLTVLAFLGQTGGGVAGAVCILPALLLGGGVYLLWGLVPALVAGGVLALPVALAVTGAIGVFRSSVWTLHFMEAR